MSAGKESPRVWIATGEEHPCQYPVGAASVVVATTEAGARGLLAEEWSRHFGLPAGEAVAKAVKVKLLEVDTEPPYTAAVILDGNY